MYSWEIATIQAGQVLNASQGMFTSYGQNVAPPALWPLCNGQTPCNYPDNLANPSVALLNIQQSTLSTAAPHTYGSYCECIYANSNGAGTNNGCKSTVSNYTF